MTTDTVITSKPCGRCGGTGKYSFNLMDGDRCYGCGGTGRVAMAPKGQKKIKPTAELRTAKIGDIISYNKVLYRIEEIVWIEEIWKGFDHFNQKMIATRLVDEKRFRLYRGVSSESIKALSTETDSHGNKTHRFGMMSVKPTKDMIGTDGNNFDSKLTDAEFAEGVAQWVARGYDADKFVR
jgi:hypothetical protein